jgi:hypothetical protein
MNRVVITMNVRINVEKAAGPCEPGIWLALWPRDATVKCYGEAQAFKVLTISPIYLRRP